VSSSIVLIAPEHALPTLSERLDSGVELRSFTDVEALEALDHVIRSKPRIIALEKDFSATSRGRALINRINDDPSLRDCEIRVVAHDVSANRIGSRRAITPSGTALAVDEPKVATSTGPAAVGGQLDHRGTRRAPRFEVREGVEVLVDGNPVALVDISAVGVQVLSPKMLRPNQRVRVTLPDRARAVRCDGSIAWAAYEMPKGQSPRYRAGIELSGADPAAVTNYAKAHTKV
jgi:hypothetical protein